jgi:hypothetical protein
MPQSIPSRPTPKFGRYSSGNSSRGWQRILSSRTTELPLGIELINEANDTGLLLGREAFDLVNEL